MGNPTLTHKAHHCSFSPDRKDPYIRLGTVTVYVRDQDRSLRFYLDQLGFSLAVDSRLPSGERWIAVSPPDGTAMLTLVAPPPGSEESKLIGRPTQIAFLTEDIAAKFDEWQKRGVRFHHPPLSESCDAAFAAFEDLDGNSFTLLAYDEMTREIEARRREHAQHREFERRIAHERETARQTQARLFPQAPPPLRSLDCNGVCMPAREVGGDYYDFLELGRERVGLVIGDVSGKGTAAALMMANLQAHLRNLSPSYWNRPFTPMALEQPARLLCTLNRLFYESTTETTYTTLCFAEFDDQTQRLRFANCGHPAALLVRRDSQIERLDPTSTVLGLSANWDCGVGESQLFPGDTLVFYTDGVIESFNEAEEEFGEARLLEAVQKRRGLPPRDLAESLLEEVRRFSPHEQHDDITFVVATCKTN